MKLLTLSVVCSLSLSAAYAQIEQFQCSGTGFPANMRQWVLELHNQLRKQMAHGQAPNNCGLLPEGKNIYKLRYSCDLEAQAYEKVKTCSGGSTWMQSAPMDQATFNAKIMKTLTDYWNTVVQYGANETLFPNSGAGGWKNMAYDSLAQVGCALAECLPTSTSSWYKYSYTCMYDSPVYSNYPTYKAGPVCKQDTDCNARTHSKCLVDEGMCDYSPDYPRENGPNEICPNGSPRLDDTARLAALKKHNEYRSSLIHGKEPMGTDGSLAPGGGSMYKIVWNCGIELKAQEWCSQLTSLKHSTNEFRNYDGMSHGENLAGTFGDVMTASAMLERSSDMWWDELREFGWQGVANRTLTRPDFDASIGHWSQMAWADTYQLGCGISPNGVVCCQYGPAGNYINIRVIYPEGAPCKTDAECTKNPGDTCSSPDGLCVHA